jgi:hypothetical protein
MQLGTPWSSGPAATFPSARPKNFSVRRFHATRLKTSAPVSAQPCSIFTARGGSLRQLWSALLREWYTRTVAVHRPGRACELPRLTPLARTSGRSRGRLSRQVILKLALVAMGMLIAPAARAQLNLRWDAPPGCPARGEVLDRIRALAGSSLDKTEGLSAEGRIARTQSRFWLTLVVREGGQVRKRVISADSCADLAGAAAITLALLLGVDVSAGDSRAQNDPRGAAPQTAPDQGERSDGANEDRRREQQSERGATERAKQSDELADRSRVPSDGLAAPGGSSSARRWTLLIRAPIVAADVGPLPQPSAGVGVGAGIGYETWRFLIAGHVHRGQTINAADSGASFAAGADLERITAHVGTCRGWRSAKFEIAPCVGLAIEHLNAQGFGQGVSPEVRRALWAAPSAGAVAHWYALKSLAFFAGATGYLELSRPRLVIEGLGEVRQLGPVAARLTLGLELIL